MSNFEDFDPDRVADFFLSGLSAQAPKAVPFMRPVQYRDLYITTKDAQLVRFQPNPMQIRFNDDVFAKTGKDWRFDPHGLKRIRRLILKGRQFGFSTNTLALFFMDTIQRQNVKTVIVAHDLKSTVELFKKVQLFHDKLPDEIKERIGSPSAASKYEFFWPQINSSFLIGTAGSEEFGRSQTVNNVLLSEMPSWNAGAADGIFTGLLKAVPLDGNIVNESTAKGVGNHFHRMWMDAMEKRSTYRPLFYSWKDFPEYAIRREDWDDLLPSGFDPDNLDEEEIQLQEIHNLSLEQLAWRRFQILDLPDPETFKQEFPLNWQEAFLASGQSYFKATALNKIEIYIKDNPLYLHGPKEVPPMFDNLKNAVERSLEEATGPTKYEDIFFHIYENPKKGELYAISADVSEGLNADGKHDFCSASVWKLSNWEQVAHLHGYWDTHNYGFILTELGWYYDPEGSLLIPERNNYGLAVIETIEHQTDYPLGDMGLYRHEDDKYGWPQNVRSRAYALETGKKLVHDGSLIIRSERTLQEMRTFVKKEGKKVEALSGTFDDCVLDLCIFAAVVYEAPVHYIAPVAGGREKFFTSAPKKVFAPPTPNMPLVKPFADRELRNIK